MGFEMKLRALFLKSLSLCALGSPTVFAADEEVEFYRNYAREISALTTRIESFIAQDVIPKGKFIEYPPARRYAMWDLDGDTKSDLVVSTTFEFTNGGNYHESHLFAALSSEPGRVQHLVVGGRGSRQADHFEETGFALYLHLRVWAKGDAQCCPSLMTTEEVVVEKGRLVLKPFETLKR